VQRVLAPAPWFLYASPEYLEGRGLPLLPQDLANHDSLAMLRPGHPATWKLRHGTRGEEVITLKPRLSGNDLMMLKHAAAQGLGVAALPRYICRDDVRSGRLQCVLPDWLAGDANITAVIPFRHGILPSVRAFLDYLIQEVPRSVSN
jgi:DNA-binding transcriptional LysR family regulator